VPYRYSDSEAATLGIKVLKLSIVVGIVISAGGLSASALSGFVAADGRGSRIQNTQQPPAVKATETKPDDAMPTLEQILDKYVQAIGGRAAVQAPTSRVLKGTLTAAAFGAKGTIEIYTKAPNKELTVIEVSIFGSSRTGFNGSNAWEEENGAVKDLPGFPKREADFYFPINLRQLFPRIELKGKEKIGNRDAYRLEAPRGGNPRRWYFDIETGLLLRTEARNAEGKLVDSEDYEDYRVVDGIQIPFTRRGTDEGIETVIKLSEVKHNIPIDDAKFEKPVAKSIAALSSAEQEAAAQLKTETIREVTTALASKEMEGRGMAQPGGDRAAKYLADRFAQIGLMPGLKPGLRAEADASAYLQNIKVKIETPLPGTSFKVGDNVFKFKTDFGLASPASPSELKDASGELVFVGYGVVSDELKRDDLTGIDVKGKIVMVLKGKPQNVGSAVWDKAADERVVFGRLIRKGAAGFVVNYLGDMSHFPTVAAYVSHRSVSLVAPPPHPFIPARWSIELLVDEFKVPPSVLVSDSTAERILGISGGTFARVKQRAEAGEFVSRDLKLRASISPRVKREEGMGSNVIGVIEGSDAKLKNEAVIYTAHYDAYGIDSEGTIYPGAMDNALGVGKLVALAEAFARLTPKPRRTIIFIATTGEESGNLGVEHWLQNPTWPIERVAANINYDGGIDVWGKLGFVLDFGFSQSDLDRVIRAVAAAGNIELIRDPMPEEQYSTRGDHYEFAKRGIPALFLSGAPDMDPQVLTDRVGKWQAAHYHMPTDTVQPDWNWEGARMLDVLGLIVGMRIANQEAMPAWKTDSPFNRPRGTTLPPPKQ
jgi:hypothetical protein